MKHEKTPKAIQQASDGRWRRQSLFKDKREVIKGTALKFQHNETRWIDVRCEM